MASGGRAGLLQLSYGALGNRERDAKKMLLRIKDPLAPDQSRIKCPSCGASYVYKVAPDTESVSCQNCAKPILIDTSDSQSTDSPKIA